MAVHLADRFPEELARRVSSKRKQWSNEHPRMDLFDAVGLAVALITSWASQRKDGDP